MAALQQQGASGAASRPRQAVEADRRALSRAYQRSPADRRAPGDARVASPAPQQGPAGRGPPQGGQGRRGELSPAEYASALANVLVDRGLQAAIDLASSFTIAAAEVQTVLRLLQEEVEQRALAGQGQRRPRASAGRSGARPGREASRVAPRPPDVQESIDLLRAEVAKARAEVRSYRRKTELFPWRTEQK